MSARRLVSVLVATGASLAVVPAVAAAESPPDSKPRTMDVTVQIQRFAVQGKRVVAKGQARAGLQDASGATSFATKPVTFAVKGGGSTCRVLTLHLDTLQLTLLGLRVDTSAVNLLITGAPQGGVLGSLFCRLAKGIKLGSVAKATSAARTLNRRMAGRPLRPIGFSAQVRPTDQPAASPQASAAQAQPPAGSCQVLDLILGPLNLDLLGLRVDLYGATATQPVRVLITADPNGGILGQVFCRLASGQAASA